MTELQVQLFKLGLKNCKNQKSVSTQTGETKNIFIYLENKKTIRTYYSSVYKEHVLSINFGTAKSFIFTKPMWKKFRKNIDLIDEILS